MNQTPENVSGCKANIFHHLSFKEKLNFNAIIKLAFLFIFNLNLPDPHNKDLKIQNDVGIVLRSHKICV